MDRRTIYRQISSTPNSSRYPSEDWVQQAGGLRIDSPLYPPSESYATPPPDGDVDMAMDSDEHGTNESDNLELEPVQMESSVTPHFPQSHLPIPQEIQQHQPGPPSTPRHSYATRYSERMQASAIINVVPATPLNSQQYVHHPPEAQGVGAINPNPGLVFSASLPSTPPPPGPIPMAISPTNTFAQLAPPSSQRTAKRRVVFGPRANCEKCRLGEKHFIHYEQ
ncbi:hypothetical protein CPB84DRAFT_1842324 [Gymnopilus junonius]|uniref:Uncharacterized protein n=1 Tax=Gymnopilus junonius TaxID=109634 RepID=A0A9P5NW01_GYMJU|nr:hypothetical protein CPB84DRAFT_1842324 [Gymnopilus junonius]